VYLAFVFVFELGSLICGVAPSSTVLIVGRSVAGLGVSGMVNGALSIIASGVEREKSPLYTGILIGTAQMGEPTWREEALKCLTDCWSRNCNGSTDWGCID
jgi:MFS family permease